MNQNRKKLTLQAIVAVGLALLAAPAWGEPWKLEAYSGCTNPNLFVDQCMPDLSSVEQTLRSLAGVAMDKGWLPWKRMRAELGDNWAVPFINPLYLYKEGARRHLQSIQYIGSPAGDKYLIAPMGDEYQSDGSGIHLILKDKFGLQHKGGEKDAIVYQLLLNDVNDYDVNRFNHSGGSQLIGQYLVVALEDFKTAITDAIIAAPETTGSEGPPVTGVWEIVPRPTQPRFCFKYVIPATTYTPNNDNHHSTAAVAVTRLTDDALLLVACAGPDKWSSGSERIGNFFEPVR